LSLYWLLALPVSSCCGLRLHSLSDSHFAPGLQRLRYPHLLLWCFCWHSRAAWLGV